MAFHYDAIKARESIEFNRRIAYLGDIGRRRRDYCIHYAEEKRTLIEHIKGKQQETASTAGKSISCHEGCYFCCAEPIQAYLEECEAIVYFLYQHEQSLESFLNVYPKWASEVIKYNDVLVRMDVIQKRIWKEGPTKELMDALSAESVAYWKNQIFCPFLVAGKCSIYEVRPWVCASIVSISPSEWCDPANPNSPKVLRAQFSPTTEIQFYYDKWARVSYLDNLPQFIHNILTGGLLYLSNAVPGLDDLLKDFVSDPEVSRLADQLREKNS